MNSLDVNGVRLHYQLDGAADAPVVMLSNSLASNLSMWDSQVPALLDAGYRVLRYDTRGHGHSDVLPGPYTITQLAGDALGLLDALGLGKVHFCGLSLGGMTGQMLATHHGERLLSLTLCATAAYMGPPDLWEGRIRQVTEHGMASVLDATLQRWFSPEGLAQMGAVLDPVKAGILSTPPAGYAGCGAAVRDMDQRETIRAIRTPTLVIVGADDPGTTVEHANLMVSRIAGAQLIVLPDSRHLLNIELPVPFNVGLLTFLKAHS